MNTVPTGLTQTSLPRLWHGVGPVSVRAAHREGRCAVVGPYSVLSLPPASGVWRLHLTLGVELRVVVF